MILLTRLNGSQVGLNPEGSDSTSFATVSASGWRRLVPTLCWSRRASPPFGSAPRQDSETALPTPPLGRALGTTARATPPTPFIFCVACVRTTTSKTRAPGPSCAKPSGSRRCALVAQLGEQALGHLAQLCCVQFIEGLLVDHHDPQCAKPPLQRPLAHLPIALKSSLNR
jgi:hypothetical protein